MVNTAYVGWRGGMVAPPCGRMRCGRKKFDIGIAGCLDGCVTLCWGEVY